MSNPATLLERTNEHGISRTERDRLINDVEDFISEHCTGDVARRITVQITVELKGKSNAT